MIKTVEELGRAEVASVTLDKRFAPPASDAPPPRIPELIQLFHAINALNTHHQPYVLQFMGSVPGEGVSMIASSFIEIAAQRGKPVLLIDCNPSAAEAAAAPSLIDAIHKTGSIEFGDLESAWPPGRRPCLSFNRRRCATEYRCRRFAQAVRFGEEILSNRRAGLPTSQPDTGIAGARPLLRRHCACYRGRDYLASDHRRNQAGAGAVRRPDNRHRVQSV